MVWGWSAPEDEGSSPAGGSRFQDHNAVEHPPRQSTAIDGNPMGTSDLDGDDHDATHRLPINRHFHEMPNQSNLEKEMINYYGPPADGSRGGGRKSTSRDWGAG